jgi:hypothetical protein
MVHATRTTPLDQRRPALPPERGTGARGETWLPDGTVIRMPLRTRLALIRPRMLKAQTGRAGRP